MTPRCPVDSLQVHYCQPQDSLMATMVQRTEIPGRPGVPLPYQLRADDGITSVILLCMCMLAYVLSRGRHFLWQQVKDFFSTRERSSLFAEETNTDVRYRVLLLLNTGLVFGLLVFEYLSGRLPTALHAHPIRWLGLYIVACLAYYLLKCALYSFANWTFFDKQKSRRWLDSYFLVFVGEGLLLFPLLLLVVYFDLGAEKKVLFIAFVLVLGKILLFCKCAGIFFGKYYRAFYLIVYFCALEILPSFLLGRTLITISSLL